VVGSRFNDIFIGNFSCFMQIFQFYNKKKLGLKPLAFPQKIPPSLLIHALTTLRI
jgi:hypothetical protein